MWYIFILAVKGKKKKKKKKKQPKKPNTSFIRKVVLHFKLKDGVLYSSLTGSPDFKHIT